MKKYLGGIVFAALVGVATPALADRINHFEGKPADTLEQAMANFIEYNARLDGILEKTELTAEDLGTIHQLTYALAQMAQIADTPEDLNVAFETADLDGPRKHGEAYIHSTRIIWPEL